MRQLLYLAETFLIKYVLSVTIYEYQMDFSYYDVLCLVFWFLINIYIIYIVVTRYPSLLLGILQT